MAWVVRAHAMLTQAVLVRPRRFSGNGQFCGRLLRLRRCAHRTQSSCRDAVVHPHWRGGFFDGDGSVMMCANTIYTYPAVAVVASISSDNLRAMEAFRNHFGGPLWEYHGAARRHPNWRPSYSWRIRGAAVFPILQELCDSGLCIKRGQAELLLRHQHLFPTAQSGRRLSQTVHDARRTLREDLYAVRASELSSMTNELYHMRFRATCSGRDQLLAYAAGIFDSDGCFMCVRRNERSYYYRAILCQKNKPVLDALRSLVLHGARARVHTNRSSGVSYLVISAQSDVLDFCRRIRPFVVNKARQVDILLTMQPSAEAKAFLQDMHGNQGNFAKR